MRETEVEKVVAETISNAPVGKKIEIRFPGAAIPIHVRMVFAGGWEIEYTLIPGMPLEFVRGEDGYLKEVTVTLLPSEGLKPQV